MNAELEYKLSVVRGAHPEWTYERAFHHVMAQDKFTGSFGRPKSGRELVAFASGLTASARTLVPGALSAAVARFDTKPEPVAPKAVPARPGGIVDGCTHPFAAEAARRGGILINASEVEWIVQE